MQFKGVKYTVVGVLEAKGSIFGQSQDGFLAVPITTVLNFISGLDEKLFADAGSRDIVLRPGTPKERHLSGQAYLLSYGLPQFFFHVTTAYGLLRQGGVEIGKKDFMGSY